MMSMRLVVVAFLLSLVQMVNATEGMWLPLLLEKLNEKEMRSLGMKSRPVTSIPSIKAV